jgi:hypothetical protein
MAHPESDKTAEHKGASAAQHTPAEYRKGIEGAPSQPLSANDIKEQLVRAIAALNANEARRSAMRPAADNEASLLKNAERLAVQITGTVAAVAKGALPPPVE